MATLQQLRYLIAVAEYGSINAAARELFATQSNLSTAIKDLEQELGVTIFTRSNRGVALTNDLVLRESTTAEIIEDVRSFRSEIGVLYTDDFNRRVLERAFEEADVQFHPLFEASAHVFVGENHPLAKREIISPEELAAYPRYSFEQGTVNSFYYAEEPLAWLPSARNIRCSDRGTLSNLLVSHNGYTLSTGVLSSEMSHGIASVPLDADERMRVGYIMHRERRPSELLLHYIDELHAIAQTDPDVEMLG